MKRALEAQYNLDLPLHQQYLSYLGDLAKGDLGPSFKYPGRSVNEVLESGLPVTFELGLYSLFCSFYWCAGRRICLSSTKYKPGLHPNVYGNDWICMPLLAWSSDGACVWNLF